MIIVIDGKQIEEVIEQGLWYVTDTGERKFVDFSVANANYIRETTSRDHIEHVKTLNPQRLWDDKAIKEYIERSLASRNVGNRNVLGQPWADGPYIEFATEPPIRFKFATQEEYGKVRYDMERFGWRTSDLS